MLKNTLIFVWCALSSTVSGKDLLSLFPSGEITAETPSLESAYPDQIYVQRTLQPSGDVVEYVVRIYADEMAGTTRIGSLWEVALVVSDEKGIQLVSTRVEVSGTAHIPPNKNEFRFFIFSINKNLEKTTVINIGRHNGLRVLFTRYRLPLKSVDHPKAH